MEKCEAANMCTGHGDKHNFNHASGKNLTFINNLHVPATESWPALEETSHPQSHWIKLLLGTFIQHEDKVAGIKCGFFLTLVYHSGKSSD